MLDLGRQAIMAVVNAVMPMAGGIGSLADGLLTLTAAIGDFLTGINDAAKKGKVFSKVAQGIADALGFVVSGIQTFIGFLGDVFAIPGFEAFQALLGRIQTRIGQVIDAVGGLGFGVDDAVNTMDSARWKQQIPANASEPVQRRENHCQRNHRRARRLVRHADRRHWQR